MIEIAPPTPLEDLVKIDNLRYLDKKQYLQILDLLLKKRVKELGLDINTDIYEKILQTFNEVEITFNLQDIRVFKSQSNLSQFAQKLVANLIAAGFCSEFRSDGKKSFQVFINNSHPIFDTKRTLLHEFTHVVDFCLETHYPDLYQNEKSAEISDLKNQIYLIGMTAIIVSSIAAHNLPLSYSTQVLMVGIPMLFYGFHKVIDVYRYQNRPNEIRARENSKLIPGKITRLIRNCFMGLSKIE